MKFCTKCGKENNDENKFCIGCGASFESNEQKEMTVDATVTNEVNNTKKSTLNLVGMILGIISVSLIVICCCGGFGYVSIIPGIVAVVLSSIYLKKYGNDGKAIAGLILGICGIVLSVLAIIITPMFMEEFRRQLVEGCNNGQFDDEVCETYRQLFPEWFEIFYIH